MNTEKRIQAFAKLGQKLQAYLQNPADMAFNGMQKAVHAAEIKNPWFTQTNIVMALGELAHNLTTEKLEKWLLPYPIDNVKTPKTVGLVMAGNIPLVGFHDFLSVLISGHRVQAKLSSKDSQLLPQLVHLLLETEPRFDDRIHLTSDRLSGFDAIIATGSDNSARYFEYYFGKYPHIIRKNRNSLAVLSGNESNAQLKALGEDIFSYFGLGCRNVSKLFVPDGYNFDKLFSQWDVYKNLVYHNKYGNNYEYNRSIMLLNQMPHFDTGYALLHENLSLSSPIAVLHFEYYKDIETVKARITNDAQSLQCVVSHLDIDGALPTGQTQKPELHDYADNVDTLQFLVNL